MRIRRNLPILTTLNDIMVPPKKEALSFFLFGLRGKLNWDLLTEGGYNKNRVEGIQGKQGSPE
jgi:hypothetical protein